MYYTEQDLLGKDIFVEKDRNARMKQKLVITQTFGTQNQAQNKKKSKYGFIRRKNFNSKKGYYTGFKKK